MRTRSRASDRRIGSKGWVISTDSQSPSIPVATRMTSTMREDLVTRISTLDTRLE